MSDLDKLMSLLNDFGLRYTTRNVVVSGIRHCTEVYMKWCGVAIMFVFDSDSAFNHIGVER